MNWSGIVEKSGLKFLHSDMQDDKAPQNSYFELLQDFRNLLRSLELYTNTANSF